jgi:membrane-bound serine protease (ClpP class)
MFWLGIIFIVLAVGLIIGELFTGTTLMLVGGLVALIFGLIVLFTQGSVLLGVNWWLVVPLIIVVLALMAFVIWRVIKTYRRKAVTGKEDLVGQTAEVKEPLDPEGTVFYQGEYWNAISNSGKIDHGEEVIIEKVDGLILIVARKTKP